MTVEELSRGQHRDNAYHSYGAGYDALLAEHGVKARPSFTGDLPVFVAEAGSGQPVLFLHGTPATSAVWIPLLTELNDVQAILVDRPGHGLSGAYDYAGCPDLRAHAVDFVSGLLDSLGLDQVVLAGNSLGGLWALWFALDRPERVRALVEIGAPPGLLGPRLPAMFGMLSVPWIARLLNRLEPPSDASTRRLFRRMGDRPEVLTAHFVRAFTTGMSLPSVAGGMTRLIQRFVRMPGRFADRRIWLEAPDLAGLEVPSLFVWGGRDFLGGPARGRQVAAAVPGARLVELDAGHLPWLERPNEVAQAVRTFLAALGPGGSR